MVQHTVIFWLNDMDEKEKQEVKVKIKDMLEQLVDVIPGIIKLNVITDLMDTSDGDIVLDSIFESKEALEAYQIHPEHKKVGNYIATMRKNRICIDYYKG